jgi:hypothetical protein
MLWVVRCCKRDQVRRVRVPSARAHGMRSLVASVSARVCLGGLAGLLYATPVAASASQHVTLKSSAPAGCPTTDDILHAIDTQLGADFATDTTLQASVRISAHGPHDFALKLSYDATPGFSDEREIHGESCAAVADAAALVLALALSPNKSEARTEPVSKASWTLELGAAALLDTAAQAEVAVGGALRIGVGFGSVHFDISANDFLPTETEHTGVTTRLHLWSLGVGVCYLPSWGPWELGPCGRFEVGQLSGEAHGSVEAAQAGAARLQAATLGAEIRLQILTPLWLVLDAGLEWIARRPQFVIVGDGTVSNPHNFGARMAFGPLLTW